MTYNHILIGGQALRIGLSEHGITYPESPEYDYLSLDMDNPPYHPGKIVDLIDGTGIMENYTFTSDVASLDEIYTLKVSHSPWIIGSSWSKHIRHIRALRDIGCQLIPVLHDAAYSQWEKRHGEKRVNLDQNKDEFFSEAVPRIYDHDSVHAALSLGDHPGYLEILMQGEQVKVSRPLFDALPLERKIQLVQEEVMVLSVERDLLPLSQSHEITRKDIILSYTSQLQRVITQYSKGWFPQFIIEYYFECADIPGNYWERILSTDKLIPLSYANKTNEGER